ncbi:MAG: HAD-IC family P-type ATPase [Ruminococcus sp.]|nr:HAD-IC family P-type ATPase [Ruminococcus sp.]
MINDRIISLSLSDSEVKERIEKGLVNKNSQSKSKSIKRIIFDNTVTLFNLLNLFLMLLLLIVGSYKNMLFMGVVLCNTIVGIIQEIRSKRAVDKLSIVVSSNVDVVRSGEIESISIDDIVLDDIIILRSGVQIPCDCEIVDGFCYANESLLTGESDQIEKNIGDSLMSGSFVSSGEVYARVLHIGKDNYATKLHREASYTKKINSEIMNTLGKIITFCSVAIFPMGIALFINQHYFNHISVNDAIVSTVAALIGMIPEGLILLTSTVLAVSVVRLARRNVLVQQLFCIETLARVDVLCLDKTGTITTGELEVVDIDYLDSDSAYVDKVLKSLAESSMDKNSTITAIDRYINCKTMKAFQVIPFSSEKKWSGAVLDDGKAYVLGAAECIFDNSQKELFDIINEIPDIFRVVTLAVSDTEFTDKDTLPENLKPIALIKIKDQIRDNAAETINFFKEQGVRLKVISGDNNKTVQQIATAVGIPDTDKSVDATTLDTEEKIKNAIERNTVFGRVTPQQKRCFVQALKENGHTVAMTGDGVNDVLALKEADCSIAIASGSDAAKNISQLVLIDNDFGSMPKVVAEGRRSINNIQRSASLFIVKTLYSIILAFAFIFVDINYPFQPLQLSLISAFTIGLPSFVLALQPNKNRIQGKFIKNVILRAWSAAFMDVLNILTLVFFMDNLSYEEFSTMAVILTALVGVMMVIRLSIPINVLRGALIAVVISGIVIGVLVFGELFNIVLLSPFSLTILAVLSAISIIVYNILYTISSRFIKS